MRRAGIVGRGTGMADGKSKTGKHNRCLGHRVIPHRLECKGHSREGGTEEAAAH